MLLTIVGLICYSESAREGADVSFADPDEERQVSEGSLKSRGHLSQDDLDAIREEEEIAIVTWTRRRKKALLTNVLSLALYLLMWVTILTQRYRAYLGKENNTNVIKDWQKCVFKNFLGSGGSDAAWKSACGETAPGLTDAAPAAGWFLFVVSGHSIVLFVTYFRDIRRSLLRRLYHVAVRIQVKPMSMSSGADPNSPFDVPRGSLRVGSNQSVRHLSSAGHNCGKRNAIQPARGSTHGDPAHRDQGDPVQGGEEVRGAAPSSVRRAGNSPFDVPTTSLRRPESHKESPRSRRRAQALAQSEAEAQAQAQAEAEVHAGAGAGMHTRNSAGGGAGTSTGIGTGGSNGAAVIQ
jgi:hypothetical protein